MVMIFTAFRTGRWPLSWKDVMRKLVVMIENRISYWPLVKDRSEPSYLLEIVQFTEIR